ncbi:MAG: plastocyanin/azurin family copper-binding protein [Acidobacteriota bacterium]
MKRTLFALLTTAVLVAAPLRAGDIHGQLTCKGASCADAVVYVDKIAGKTFPAPKDHALVNQLNMKFLPRVLAVEVGTTVDFLNSDKVQHNVFSPDACADKFNLGTWAQGQKKSRTFTKECFASLLCLIHPEMEGFIAVVPTPYFTTVGADGSYKISEVPDGAYTLKVWHPKLKGAPQSVNVKGSTEANFEIGH